MRIIGGRHKGHPLVAPAGLATRPTAARAREGLFNILSHSGLGPGGASAVEGAHVLEAFAGTGAFAFEALSRGAAGATLLDLDEAAVDAARRNARKLQEPAAVVLKMDAVRPRRARTEHDLVFMDPPYGSRLAGKSLAALAAKGWIAPDALVVVEVAAREDFTPPDGFDAVKERSFGAARFVILRHR